MSVIELCKNEEYLRIGVVELYDECFRVKELLSNAARIGTYGLLEHALKV